ncbi:branched-chain amino acid ABC transporter permease [Campylobacter hepaticus]|uniref:Branched-chain amino acid ABC transporter permease n=1 Tax=Campylobacter hepaticus TaxID=1813019 RepID=A0A6A7JTZ8_9BACT|nr:branched-chain amino acid ABC transporter permease [Campylobacter hepaticus]AXP08486.1 branched-chain amino acid ABC transporter permease [Campylobacter hepaticus]MCZ0772322.1 branched-chain amino acid ABC transporter permease [Campylobacter hepaticus]MCZ0773790.1 branched-chain amino acid ABC transporter permease [Campylobacter hepaticus]MCZ0775041.1 branched-chain amino acid ABC transporter permease [Campylobacter hepaticus]MDX2322910.1 branched-chain amino acid ABC transporter permease [
MLKIKTSHLFFLIISFIFIFISPYIFGDYGLNILNQITIFIILAVSYNLINGVTGQFSLEPNGFVAIGAYVAALILLSSDAKNDQFFLDGPSAFILAIHSNSFLLALFAAGFCATLLALILSFAVFRVRGDYLAIVTLGFGIIIKIIAINFPSITNGSRGLVDIPQFSTIYWTGGIAVVAVILILNIVYSKYGRAMKAIRDDEDAANAMGINTFWIKTLAFGTSAFLEGLGGGLLACLLTTVSPMQFDFLLTFELLIIIVLGGLGSTTGAIIGSVLVIGGSEWLRFLDELNIKINFLNLHIESTPGFRMVVFSLILILVMLFARKGIMGYYELSDLLKKIGKCFNEKRGKK